MHSRKGEWGKCAMNRGIIVWECFSKFTATMPNVCKAIIATNPGF